MIHLCWVPGFQRLLEAPPLGASGEFLRPLGNLWELLRASGSFLWEPLGAFGSL